MIGLETLRGNIQDFQVDWKLKRTATPTSVEWAKEQVADLPPRMRDAVMFEKAVDAALDGDEADTAAILLQTDLETHLKADLLELAQETPFSESVILGDTITPEPITEAVPENVISSADIDLVESKPEFILSFGD